MFNLKLLSADSGFPSPISPKECTFGNKEPQQTARKFIVLTVTKRRKKYQGPKKLTYS
jgi:hypothetical protein